MKKFFFALLIGAFTLSLSSVPTVKADAQSTKLTSKTITAADTITFSAVPSNIVAFQYSYDETSGTSGGYVILEGSIISGAWVSIDTLTITDVATAQVKTVPITATTYLNYRYRCTNPSSATAAVKASYLRRSDE